MHTHTDLDLTPTTIDADPQLTRMARRAPAFSFGRRTLRLARLLTNRMQRRVQGQLAPGTHASDHTVDDAVEVRLYRPSATTDDRLAVLVWIHGGGLIMGTHREDLTASRFVSELGIAVASVGYRLAPEHPYPAAVDDVWAAIEWLHTDGPALGLDPERLAVGGASAGGGLAAAVAQRAHDRGVTLRGQLLSYPMLDDRTAARTDIGPRDHKGWTNRSNHLGWSSYLSTEPGANDVPADAAPARRRDLTGLAPAWVGVGMPDLFIDEDRAYAQRLHSAGVACELVVVEDGIHDFHLLVPDSTAAKAFVASQTAFLHDVLRA